MRTIREKRVFEKINASSGAYFSAYTVVDVTRSEYQRIEVYDTPELGKLLRIDDCNMLAERDAFIYHEAIVHPAAICANKPKTALVLGGGDGCVAAELLKHNTITQVDLVELDAAVVALCKEHFAATNFNVFDNPKLSLHITDAHTFMQVSQAKYDLICLDLTDPDAGEAHSASLFTAPFFAQCKAALNTGGVLSLFAGSPFSHARRFTETVAALACQFKFVHPYFAHVPSYAMLCGFVAAADTVDIATATPADIEATLIARQIGRCGFYNGVTHSAMLAQPEYVRRLLANANVEDK
jgi:spermidine synthase